MEKSLQSFIENHINTIRPLLNELYQLSWEYDTTGNKNLLEKKKELEAKYIAVHANKESLEKLNEFQASGKIENPELKRQLKLLANRYRLNHVDPEYIERMVELETDITTEYNHFRGKLDGKPLNDNQIKEILCHETDNEIRKKAWEASKQIGERVSKSVLELVKLRNENARKQGFPDYYTMALKCKEMSEEKLFATFNRLKELTDEKFREVKGRLDEERSQKFGISSNEMQAWHYADPFFQEIPPYGKVDMDPLFKEANIEKITEETYTSIGLEIKDILESSDLYPKEGKCQHAYCAMLNRETKDVRVLCNIDQTERWASTMIHEFGHAVYDKYISPELPFLLHTPAHTLSTEAIAMMMDSLSKEKKWLVEIVKVPVDKVDEIGDQLAEAQSIWQIIFARWAMVMVNFERELYRNPDQDLNKLWWDYVEKFQYVPRPKGRNSADWAAKIHMALVPVYYHNYVYGEMVANQLKAYIKKNVGNGQLFNNMEVGKYLTEKYFTYGTLYDWNGVLEKATGEPLNIDYYLQYALRVS